MGFMGAGKTTISETLAKMLAARPVDTDSEIEKQEGMPVSEIFKEKGEEYFRNLETKLLESLSAYDRQIISCGGGMPLKWQNRKLMRKCGATVFLTAEPSTILERIGDAKSRPVLAGRADEETISAILEERMPAYLEAADIVIATDGRTPHQISVEIINKVADLAANGGR